MQVGLKFHDRTEHGHYLSPEKAAGILLRQINKLVYVTFLLMDPVVSDDLNFFEKLNRKPPAEVCLIESGSLL